MAEHYFIPSREEANRFSEAYLEAQREYHEHLNLAYENGYEAGKKDATQKWIPVKERLPEEFQKVLVFWREHSEPMIDTAFWQKEATRFDGEHWVRMEDKVTHWMPLPEPPKEAEE